MFKAKRKNCIGPFNAFSPEGDGKNDKWHINGIEQYPDNIVKIFNRWGDKVNEIENYNNNDKIWKGRDKEGKELTEGTYFYIIQTTNKKRSGWVELMR
ncbi:MAG: gliding motility-associated C-terminal domain-containing protein [Flavobacteriales bacterium]